MSMTISKRRWTGWVAALGLAGACAFLAACGDQPTESAPVARPVRIAEIGSPAEGRVREYPGFVRASRSAELGFEVPGRVIRIDARQGQQVAAGTALAALDDRDYAAELEVALANQRKAEADLRRSEAVYAEDPGAITLERIDGDRRALDVAVARVAQARKSVEDTVLRAPFTGVVSRRLVELYENVQAKQPVLIVENLESIEVEVNVPERDVGARTAISGYTAEEMEALTERFMPRIQVSAIGDTMFPGRIVEIATRADAATRTFALRIAFEPPQGIVTLPGMTARVTVGLDQAPGLTLPLSALVATPAGRPKVWVIDPSTMTAQGREIEIGTVGNGFVEVLGGLTSGELVATTGAQQLAEGMRVSRFEGAL